MKLNISILVNLLSFVFFVSFVSALSTGSDVTKECIDSYLVKEYENTDGNITNCTTSDVIVSNIISGADYSLENTKKCIHLDLILKYVHRPVTRTNVICTLLLHKE